MSELDHVIQSLCRFSLTGLAALLRLYNPYRICFLILALYLAASIAEQNLAALLIPISDGVRLILLNSWAQLIVALRILVRRKPYLIFYAAKVLSENLFARFTISESPSVRMTS